MSLHFNLNLNLPLSYLIKSGILLIFISACRQQPQQQPPPTPTVTVSPPMQKSIALTNEYIGRFRAIERVEVRARVSGYLEEINFNDGQIVEKGDILFVIDQRPFEVALKQAKADLENAETRLELAEKEFNRVKGLENTGAISQEQFDQRSQELLSARAAHASAEADVDAASLDLEFTEIKAPVTGRISENFVSIGNFISGGNSSATLLTRIVSLDPIYFTFEATEGQLLSFLRDQQADSGSARISDPRPIYVKLLDEKNFEHRGELNFIDNAIDRSTGTLMGRATFENNNRLLQPGMFGRAKVSIGGEKKRLLIPDKIISSNQATKFVLVVNDSNTVKRKVVETGELYRNLRIIKEGLTPEDQIIIAGISKATEGQQVNIKEGKIEISAEDN